MKYLAQIEILPHKELLDPQGKAVTTGLKNIGFANIENVRVGKFITFMLEAANEQEASKTAEQACKKLLVNPIMESFHVKISLAE
jgi:phosphoribosylformylglycinamidine synthase subunit PurS